MDQSNKDLESTAAQIDVRNGKYFAITLLCCILLGVLAMGIAENFGLDAKLWWPIFGALSVNLASIFVSYLANKRYKELSDKLPADSLGLKKAHYAAIRAKHGMRVFIWLPCLVLFYPVILKAFQFKASAYLTLCFVILKGIGDYIGDKRATDETGFSLYTKTKT